MKISPNLRRIKWHLPSLSLCRCDPLSNDIRILYGFRVYLTSIYLVCASAWFMRCGTCELARLVACEKTHPGIVNTPSSPASPFDFCLSRLSSFIRGITFSPALAPTLPFTGSQRPTKLKYRNIYLGWHMSYEQEPSVCVCACVPTIQKHVQLSTHRRTRIHHPRKLWKWYEMTNEMWHVTVLLLFGRSSILRLVI